MGLRTQDPFVTVVDSYERSHRPDDLDSDNFEALVSSLLSSLYWTPKTAVVPRDHGRRTSLLRHGTAGTRTLVRRLDSDPAA